MINGSLTISAGVMGTLCGGFILKKLKSSVTKTIYFIAIVQIITIVCLFHFLFYCPELKECGSIPKLTPPTLVQPQSEPEDPCKAQSCKYLEIYLLLSKFHFQFH